MPNDEETTKIPSASKGEVDVDDEAVLDVLTRRAELEAVQHGVAGDWKQSKSMDKKETIPYGDELLVSASVAIPGASDVGTVNEDAGEPLNLRRDRDTAVMDVLTKRTKLEAKQYELENQEEVLVQTGLATEKAPASKNYEQIPQPRLIRAPNQPQRVQQPGAYMAVPGTALQRIDNHMISLLGTTDTAAVEQGDTEPPTASNISGLVEARAVTEEGTMNMNLPTAQQMDQEDFERVSIKKQKEKQRCITGFGLMVVGLVVVGIILGVAFTKGDSATITVSPTMAPSSMPSSAPTGYLDRLVDDLPDYTQESLQNFSTPQWKAFDWLTHHQNLTRLPEWRKMQLFAMATFFYAFEGENWNPLIKERWLDDTVDECLWYSGAWGRFVAVGEGANQTWVYQEWDMEKENPDPFPQKNPCNNQGELALLDLENLLLKNFTPTLPPEISLLSALHEINLNHCELTSSLNDMLPTELRNMTNLKVISLSVNPFQGSLPTELGLMTHLTALKLRLNGFSGSMPSELASMTELTHLELDENTLNGTIPSELGLLTSLTNLLLRYNSFSGTLPFEEVLSQMTNLSMLTVDGNSLTGGIPSELGFLTGLTLLDLSTNMFSGSLPTEFARLTNLLWVGLGWGNSLSGSICSELGEMTALVEIYLSGNSFSGSIPSELGSMKSLSWFDLSYLPMLTGSIPSEIAGLQSLRWLDLTGSSSLSGTFPDELCDLQNVSCSFVDFWETTYPCALAFDCSDFLCGCNCPCFNSTSNATNTLASDASL
jgi:hypothetical protein